MRKITYLLFAVVFMFICSGAYTQSTTIVMKALDNNSIKLNGGSTISKHLGEIDVLSYSQGEQFCTGCSKPDISSLSVMIGLSPATISFKKLLLSGTKLISVDITYIKGGTTPVEYYKIHMENVAVESVQESGSSEEPYFSISLAPEKIAWQQIKTAGTNTKTSEGWDIINNVEWVYPF